MTSFEKVLEKYAEVWEETYICFSPVIPHKSSPTQAAATDLVSANSRAELGFLEKQEMEIIKIKPNTLKEISMDQATVQLENFFADALDYTGASDMLNEEDTEKIIKAYIGQFKNPKAYANSTNEDWSSATTVTQHSKDSLIVLMDDANLQYLLSLENN